MYEVQTYLKQKILKTITIYYNKKRKNHQLYRNLYTGYITISVGSFEINLHEINIMKSLNEKNFIIKKKLFFKYFHIYYINSSNKFAMFNNTCRNNSLQY